MNKPVLINSEGYIIKSVGVEDYNQEWLDLLSREDVKNGLNFLDVDITPEFCQNLLSSYDNYHRYLLGIYSIETNDLAGFYVLDVDLYNKKAIFSLAINNAIYKNVVWKTMDHFLDYFFDYRDIEKISSRVLSTNRRVIFLLLVNSRFICEGTFQKDCLLSDGSRADTTVWSSFKNPRTYPIDFIRQ